MDRITRDLIEAYEDMIKILKGNRDKEYLYKIAREKIDKLKKIAESKEPDY